MCGVGCRLDGCVCAGKVGQDKQGVSEAGACNSNRPSRYLQLLTTHNPLPAHIPPTSHSLTHLPQSLPLCFTGVGGRPAGRGGLSPIGLCPRAIFGPPPPPHTPTPTPGPAPAPAPALGVFPTRGGGHAHPGGFPRYARPSAGSKSDCGEAGHGGGAAEATGGGGGRGAWGGDEDTEDLPGAQGK